MSRTFRRLNAIHQLEIANKILVNEVLNGKVYFSIKKHVNQNFNKLQKINLRFFREGQNPINKELKLQNKSIKFLNCRSKFNQELKNLLDEEINE